MNLRKPRNVSRSLALLAITLMSCAHGAEWEWAVSLTRYASAHQIAVQSDGKIVVFGDFQFVGRVRKPGLARLNADGSLDVSYNPEFDRPLVGISGLGDDLLVATSAIESGVRVQKLDRNGLLDAAFAPPVMRAGFAPESGNPARTGAQRLASGKIVMAGTARMPAGPPRTGVFVLNADGTLDAAFNPPEIADARGFAVEASGTILVGADAELLRLDGNTGEVLRRWQMYGLRNLMALPSGRFLLHGSFANGQALKRFNADGTEDATYESALREDRWRAPIRLRDGRYFWLGTPTVVLSAEGELERTLEHAADFNSNYNGVAEAPDGKIIYSAYDDGDVGTPAGGLGRRLASGELDKSFRAAGGLMGSIDTDWSDQTERLESGLNGALYMGGPFHFLDGARTRGLARLSGDGAMDLVFARNIEAQQIYSEDFVVEHTPERTLLLGSQLRVAATGEASLRFAPLDECMGATRSMPLANGASIMNYVYGSPCIVSGWGENSVYRRADGSFVTELDVRAEGPIEIVSIGVTAAVTAMAGGKFLIGGEFATVNGASARHVALMTEDGQVDGSFALTEEIPAPAFLFRRGEEFIAVSNGFGWGEQPTVCRVDHSGRVISKRLLPESVVSLDNCLLSEGGWLATLSNDPKGGLLVSVVGLDGVLLRQVRLPREESNFSPPAAFSSAGDLLIMGFNLAPGPNAWSGLAKVPARALEPLRLDLERDQGAWRFLVRARPGARVGIYSSEDFGAWRRVVQAVVGEDGGGTALMQEFAPAAYFRAELEE